MKPEHIAIIMDGNRRWAYKHGLPEIEGHKEGAKTLGKIVQAAIKLGVKTVTVYALSTENLQERAKREIKALFQILLEGFRTKAVQASKEGVRIGVLGEVEKLPRQIQEAIERVKNTYIKNEAIKVNIALNYGGRREIVNAVKKMIADGVDLSDVDEVTLAKRLYTNGQHEPDLVIRTGGMIRLSNFLLWQTAYSELYFTKKLWPDFKPADLKAAIAWYQKVKRNFGK